jgi:NADH-quinone oxidoreductase subunit G
MSDVPTGGGVRTPQERADAAKVAADHRAAEAAGAEMVSLTVDGAPVQVPKGTLVIEAAFRAGSDIPYFCYHPRLSSVGACRMCLASVELEMFGQRRASIMATCTIPCSDGMVVRTNTPDVKKAQSGILEFLLANHPLDCPICDRGGECPLQNMTIAYGPPTSRFVEEKRHFPKSKAISAHVVLDRERCIQCMRCTRFADEVAGDSQISLLNRGAAAEIGPFLGATFDSNFSGNTIEICPVGALTSRDYRFKGRPWEVKSTDSVCAGCGNGCNIAVQHRLGEMVRINGRTNEAINAEWTCDRGKFGQYYVNSSERLSSPLIRDAAGNLVAADWDTALAKVADALMHFARQPGRIAAIGSSRATVEDNYLLVKLVRGVLGSNSLDFRSSPFPQWLPEATIADLESANSVVSVAMDLANDQPMVYLRSVKAGRRNGSTWTHRGRVSDVLDDLGPGTVLLLPDSLPTEDYQLARDWSRERGSRLAILVSGANARGAAWSGILPETGPGGSDLRWLRGQPGWEKVSDIAGRDTTSILAGCREGLVDCLVVMGNNIGAEAKFGVDAVEAVRRVPFSVCIDLFLNETSSQADVVLPACSFVEKDGTFVNTDGIHQPIRAAFAPRGQSRPDWRILADLLARVGSPVPYFTAADVRRELDALTERIA